MSSSHATLRGSEDTSFSTRLSPPPTQLCANLACYSTSPGFCFTIYHMRIVTPTSWWFGGFSTMVSVEHLVSLRQPYFGGSHPKCGVSHNNFGIKWIRVQMMILVSMWQKNKLGSHVIDETNEKCALELTTSLFWTIASSFVIYGNQVNPEAFHF